MMFDIILVTNRPRELEPFAGALARAGRARVETVPGGRRALEMARGRSIHLVVIDQDPGDMGDRELVRRLLEVDATINTALINDMDSDQFHERYEGLGILRQLAWPPGPPEAAELLELLSGLVPPALVKK
jgi:DNA-binding NtrC family response regulator